MILPKSFEQLVNTLTILPGVGEKTAERFVYSIYEKDIEEIENLAKGGPIAYADYYINNNGSVEEYYQRLNEILGDKGQSNKFDIENWINSPENLLALANGTKVTNLTNEFYFSDSMRMFCIPIFSAIL